MKITIAGKHVDIGSALREYIENIVKEQVTKFFENAVTAHVIISKETHLFITDIIVNEGTGQKEIIKAHASDNDPYHSVDLAVKKLESQLRKYKSRLRSHAVKKLSQLTTPAVDYIISPLSREQIEDVNAAPAIIAEKPLEIEQMTVNDAVVKLDLLQKPVLLFCNNKNGHLNMVYYRKDGNIAWVDINTDKLKIN
jgi:ribosomal subunit interface protein